MKRPLVILLVASLLAAVAGFASAQIDDRARDFLEGLNDRFDIDIDTVDQTARVTTFLPDGTPVPVTSRTILDYVNRRAATFTEVAPGMQAIMLFKDGKVSMRVAGVPLPMPVPPDAAESFEEMFEPAAWSGLKEGDIATYDGPVTYGDLLAGEQVSYTTTHEIDGQEKPATTRFVFASDDALLGYLIETDDGGPLLIVLDAPATGGYLTAMSYSMYVQDGETWTLMNKTEFTEYLVNEPIDESLFE